MRKGISFTMGMIVSALVIIATAALVLGIVQPSLQDTSDQVDQTAEDNWDSLTLEQRRGNCDLQKENFCTGSIPSDVDCPDLETDQQWACRTQVGGEWCFAYWRGSYSAIPTCSSGG